MSRGMPLRDNAIAAYLSNKAADAEDAEVRAENFAVKAVEKFREVFGLSPVEVTAIGPYKAKINYEDMTFIATENGCFHVAIHLLFCQNPICGKEWISDEITDLTTLGKFLQAITQPVCDVCPYCPQPNLQLSPGEALISSLIDYIRVNG